MQLHEVPLECLGDKIRRKKSSSLFHQLVTKMTNTLDCNQIKKIRTGQQRYICTCFKSSAHESLQHLRSELAEMFTKESTTSVESRLKSNRSNKNCKDVSSNPPVVVA
jgi:molybdenum cofactor biosynthesis enzyme MoaA